MQTWQRLRAERMLRTHFSRNIKLSEIAAACSLSVRHFSRAFRECFGTSARQYLIQLRLQRARSLLARTDQPLAQIADVCGFCDQAAFTRAFRRAEGMTPARWRKSQR